MLYSINIKLPIKYILQIENFCILNTDVSTKVFTPVIKRMCDELLDKMTIKYIFNRTKNIVNL